MNFAIYAFAGVHRGSTGGPPGGPTGKHVTPYTPIPGRFQQIRRRRVGNRFAQLLVPPFIFCDFLDFDGIWPEPRKNDRSNKVSIATSEKKNHFMVEYILLLVVLENLVWKGSGVGN